ncbi:hypothetical protein [Streptomyces sp. NPDC046887]|uniref:hypothetical protein n=1 Tax=Streptomyces sp. NPDC046887 TaxID=3155472 RepID=UPI0033CD90A6
MGTGSDNTTDTRLWLGQEVADGVVALPRATTSPDLDAHEAELGWFAMHDGFRVPVPTESVVTG